MVGKKNIRIFSDGGEGPLVVYHPVRDEGAALWDACKDIGCGKFTLAAAEGTVWDSEMTPWPAPPAAGRKEPFPGGADGYIAELTEKIIPAICGTLPSEPEMKIIAGYSLAGLFSLYCVHKTDAFSAAVSASGSLWYPGFTEFMRSHGISDRAGSVYLSLGDREARTKDPVLSCVEEKTAEAEGILSSEGVDTVFELNPGGHFRDAVLRTAKGIKWILKKDPDRRK